MRGHQVRPYVRCVDTNDRSIPPAGEHPAVDPAPTQGYEIRVDGRLGTRWSPWFDGMDLTTTDNGTTVLRGPIVDQAALHGLLQKLRDLSIPLLSLTPLPPHEAVEEARLPRDQARHNPPGAIS